MTEQNNSSIKGIVMSRVHTIHTLQMVLNGTGASVGIFILALYGIGREVWVARVLQDQPAVTNLGALTRFYLSAFMDTRLPVQILAVLAVGALVWLGYNLIQMVRTPRLALQKFA